MDNQDSNIGAFEDLSTTDDTDPSNVNVLPIKCLHLRLSVIYLNNWQNMKYSIEYLISFVKICNQFEFMTIPNEVNKQKKAKELK
ncbi:uncharacterized protein KGF55_002317 [Candida pseudojiufengensis]|uniref:uncharacterized protein n=1 Tax=Candida pseudojiufengensis TaxID=497109 RepID=UPI00222456DE|nr:uncharacterized protein KGF55_002317 [Candida pseudojiufengensis]KAI5964375.1 hypothetical protein KGF55_002317 [Candida pseudojiufengensis]